MDEVPSCQWPQCGLPAPHQIHYEYERIDVCRAHRAAVQVNIESQGKIWIFKDNDTRKAEQPITRPGEQKPRRTGAATPLPATVAPGATDWQREAAQKADSLAIPVEQATDLVQPQRRTAGRRAASQILRNLTQGE